MTTRDRLRLQIGDTNTSDALFTDAELDQLLTENSDDYLLGAAAACEILATRFARDYDVKSGDDAASRGQRSEHYTALAKTLRERAGGAVKVGTFTRVDGYSDDLSSRDGAGQSRANGRIRSGYTNPDKPF